MSEREKREQAAEAAAIRRRWITLGEVLAVVAVVISGLTFWNSYQERSSAEAERQAAKQEAAAEAQRLILRGTATGEGNRRLNLVPLAADQVIQSQTISFPTALETESVDTVIAPRIESQWLKPAVKKAGETEGRGDARLPVLITTRFVSDGRSYTDSSIYDIGYKAEDGFLSGTEVELRGLSHVKRVIAENGQAELDKLWESRRL